MSRTTVTKTEQGFESLLKQAGVFLARPPHEVEIGSQLTNQSDPTLPCRGGEGKSLPNYYSFVRKAFFFLGITSGLKLDRQTGYHSATTA